MTSEATFIAAIVVILLASRLLGEAAQRFGQPAVIGQLAAGILLGPSLFGLLWPQAQEAIFPHDPAQRARLDAIAQFGVLLLLLTGMDADVKLIRAVGRTALVISAAGILIPFICGLSLGFMLPSEFLPDARRRMATALFLGVALSISSIKIVAMVVREMKFARRDLGQLIMASAILEDSIGWILIAIIFGVASAGAVDMGRLAWSVAGVALFLAASLTFGRRLVSIAIRLANDSFASEFPVVTLILVIMCGLALATHALGVQTVLGAFIAGVLIGESPILTKHISDQLRGMVASFFAPVFFTLAGLNSDLPILGSPRISPALSARSSVTRRRQVLTGRNEEAAIREVVELADHRDQPTRARSRRLAGRHSRGSRRRGRLADRAPSEALLFGEPANHLLETSPRSLMFVAN